MLRETLSKLFFVSERKLLAIWLANLSSNHLSSLFLTRKFSSNPSSTAACAAPSAWSQHKKLRTLSEFSCESLLCLDECSPRSRITLQQRSRIFLSHFMTNHSFSHDEEAAEQKWGAKCCFIQPSVRLHTGAERRSCGGSGSAELFSKGSAHSRRAFTFSSICQIPSSLDNVRS